MVGRYRMILRRVKEETPTVRSFFFTPEDGERFTFKPGHFVNLSFLDERSSLGHRSFSMSSSPTEDAVRLTIRRVGRFTSELFEAEPGTAFSMLAPLGLPYIRDENAEKKYVLIAGGTGIAPFRSLIKYMQDTAFKPETLLFYSARSANDIIFHDEWESLLVHTNARLIITLTRDAPADWQGERGHVDIPMIERYAGRLEDWGYVLCGPPGMVDTLASALEAAGVPRKQVKRERWT